MANPELPHKTAYEGIKIVPLRQYSHASIKAAVGTRLDPVCKDEAGIRWYISEDVAVWKVKRAELIYRPHPTIDPVPEETLDSP